MSLPTKFELKPSSSLSPPNVTQLNQAEVKNSVQQDPKGKCVCVCSLSQCTEAHAKQEDQSLGLMASGLDVLFAQARVHFDNKTQQIGLNHMYSMTLFISPHVSILHVKGRYDAQSESHFRSSSHCYVTTGIVPSQYPSSRDAVLEMCYLTALLLVCLNVVKTILPQENIFTTNLRFKLTVVMLFWQQ